MSDTEQRLMDLEIHVAHQEMIITELSEAVRRQWTEIDALKARLGLLVDRLRQVEDGGNAPEANQPPPHW